nr:transposase [Paludisphaera soli]
MATTSDRWIGGHQARFWKLVSGHAHAVNALATGISALPAAAGPFAAARAMTRFLNNDAIPFHALIEPAQDAVRSALAGRGGRFVLVVHGWCMFNFRTHDSKGDRRRRSHAADLGYELGSALAVDADDGRPLGPMEFRLRTAGGVLSTRLGGAEDPPGRVDELGDAMAAAESWRLPRTPVHVVDREADSVGHYRDWDAAGRLFVVRADASREVLHGGRERKLDGVAAGLAGEFVAARGDDGGPAIVTLKAGAGRIKAAEAGVVLHRAARRNTGEKTAAGGKKQVDVPGPPLPLRPVATRVVGDLGAVLAEWRLFTNVPAERADAATIGRWYARRWEVETYHKLLKSAGMNAEGWRQQEGEAFLRRLCAASLACLTVWHLRREESEEAAKLRATLVRLSGRRMKHGVESTAPALLAGLEKLLATLDLLESHDLDDLRRLARSIPPNSSTPRSADLCRQGCPPRVKGRRVRPAEAASVRRGAAGSAGGRRVRPAAWGRGRDGRGSRSRPGSSRRRRGRSGRRRRVASRSRRLGSGRRGWRGCRPRGGRRRLRARR